MADVIVNEIMESEQAIERAAYVKGLRELAAFLEAHTDLPLPVCQSHNAFVWTKDALVAIARTPGVNWQKAAVGNYFALKTRFAGGHSYDVNADRDQVCRKVVTGTRIEPAKPAQEVEEFHWVCDEPLLAGAQ